MTFKLNLENLQQLCYLERAVKKKAAALQRQSQERQQHVRGTIRSTVLGGFGCKGGGGGDNQSTAMKLEKSGPTNERICYNAKEFGLDSVGSRVPMTSLRVK